MQIKVITYVLPFRPYFYPGCDTSLIFKKLKLNPGEVIGFSFFAVLPDIDGIYFGRFRFTEYYFIIFL